MIRIRTDDLKQHVMLVVALSGECYKSDLLKFMDNEVYMRKLLKKLLDGKMLREVKVEKDKLLRLTKNGYNAIKTIPPLKDHYDALTNNNHKQNDKATVARRRGISKMTIMAAKNGYAINNIIVESNPKTGKKKKPTPPENLPGEKLALNTIYETELPYTKFTIDKSSDLLLPSLEMIAGNTNISEISYFTPHVIKTVNHKEGQGPTNRSRMRGCLMGRQVMYAMYYQDGPLQFTKTNEMYIVDAMKQIGWKIYGKEYSAKYNAENPKGEAVIYLNDAENINNILSGEWIIGPKYLDDVYTHVYIASDGTDTLEQITKAGWKKTLLQTIYDQSEIQKASDEGITGYCDALIGREEKMSIELVSMDLVKIKRSIKNIENGMQMHIVCETEQEQLMKKIYEGYGDAVEIEAIKI